MKPKKVILILGAIYLFALSFGGICSTARNWIIAANYAGYHLKTLIAIPQATSQKTNDLFGTIDGEMVNFEIAAGDAEQIRSHPQKEYKVWHNPDLPNMFFNGESVRGVLSSIWKPRREFEISAWQQAGLAVLWAAGFAWCVRTIKSLGRGNPGETAADLRPSVALRLAVAAVVFVLVGEVALSAVRLWWMNYPA